ncbi:MAG: ribonuclease D [Halothiobacillaceae bacterium]|nr:ribonuclease D [Halothiobacillaceae bacterium]MDY0049500.1 ribonuclease D [Halothiobacillaceae bacterium]
MTSTSPETGLYIETAPALHDLCATLARSPYIALDTEFVREKTYYAQLCLIQVATDDVVACIDPLRLEDLNPLWEVLERTDIVKVFHAGGQDLEIFHQLTGRLPRNLFDTQIAATVLGFGEQIGYAALVQALLDIELDKSMSRTDWSQRPLSPAQLRYAEDDVRHLRRVYALQRARLNEQGREDWLREDFLALEDPARYEQAADQAWTRLRGVHHLRGVQLAVAQRIAAWREDRARHENRPRRWFLPDELILDLSKLMPRAPRELHALRGWPRGVMESHGPRLLELIQQARELPEGQWPELAPRLRLSEEQEIAALLVQTALRIQSEAHGVSPATFAGNREVEALVAGERALPLLTGWRRRLAGETALAVLEGQLAIGLRDGRAQLYPATPV